MLLAIDTATRRVGLALYDGAQVLHEVTLASPSRHTVDLAPAVERALAGTAGLGDLRAVAVALGPGSFTGLRIGVAFAKGLALARHLPLVGIPTHDILAHAQPLGGEERLAAVIEAGRGRLAVAWYIPGEGRWVADGSPQLLTPEDLSKEIRTPTRVCGDLDEDTRKLLSRKRKNVLLVSPAASLRRAGHLAELAWERWQAGHTDDPATLAPVYIRTNEDLPA
ncbi:MAG: tRNA (adenosine(37)-N6)-threonylcarbamoyltransferase complex dimerization subunit type 1 TsaB [Anaerolineae bacterium]|nr:MAG: tRNA (adenosine(37)-N6)-threonylcarbamoyltransferase complex dimerization subunit type 1 TsaB [Anaerolineae bacterium]